MDFQEIGALFYLPQDKVLALVRRNFDSYNGD